MADDQVFDAGTLGAMAARITRWARERIDPDTLYDAINDARETLWNTATLASISKFVGSPVQIQFPANTSEYTIVSIPDPQIYAQVGELAGGALPARAYTVTISYVTDGGGETRESLATQVNIDANTLAAVTPPPYVDQAVGYNVYAGIADRRILQNPQPLPFNITWVELPMGISSASGGVLPPQQNTTGDNISNIRRLDVLNTDGQTFTKWLQTSVNSTAFTQFQNSYPTTCTWQRYAYDIIGNRKIEIRPQTGTDLSATAFFVYRPHRLRFPISRIGFDNIAAAQTFIAREALSDVLDSLYEDEAADRWQAKADRTKQEILMAIVNETWDQNDTVRAYQPQGRQGYSGVVS